MTHIIHRRLDAAPPTAVRGEGIRLFDASGKSYIDASGGAAVSCLGHAHPEVLAAIHAQVDRLAYAHTGFFNSEPAEALAAQLAQHAPAGLDYVYFTSGGSEAIEAALKLARQYFVEIGEPQRAVFVARRQSYHGNTLGALAVGGNAWRRAQFAPLLMDVAHVSPCYEYRDRRTDESRDAYTQRLLAEQEGVVPDLVAIAKGLGGGYQPIGAVLAPARIIDALKRGSGIFQHGHTYGGHPTAAAAALAVQQVIQRDGLLDRVKARGAYLVRALQARFGADPHVGDIRGRGLFIAVELVADRASKEPFDPELRLHARIKARAFENGLMVYPMGGTIDGRRGDHVLLAPPFIVAEDELDRIVDLLATSIEEALTATREVSSHVAAGG